MKNTKKTSSKQETAAQAYDKHQRMINAAIKLLKKQLRKDRKDEITWASVGSQNHIANELFEILAFAIDEDEDTIYNALAEQMTNDRIN